MRYVSVNLVEQEWTRIAGEAAKAWQGETLSNAEIMRRCAILGVQTLHHLSPETAKQFVMVYRTGQRTRFGAAHLTTPAHARSDHPGQKKFAILIGSRLQIRGPDVVAAVACLSGRGDDLFSGERGCPLSMRFQRGRVSIKGLA